MLSVQLQEDKVLAAASTCACIHSHAFLCTSDNFFVHKQKVRTGGPSVPEMLL